MNFDKRGSGLSESIEDYIEQIYIDSKKDGSGVRITDLAEAMEVSKASVNDAVKKLKRMGYVEHERYGQVYLTESGIKAGEQVYERHRTITRFFHEVLGVSLQQAEEDACGLEHILSAESYEALQRFLKNYPVKNPTFEE